METKKWDTMIPQSGSLVSKTGYTVSRAELIERMLTSMTSFEEIMTATLNPQIELQSTYGITKLRDKIYEINGGTVTNTTGEYRLQTAAQTSSVARLDTKERGRYLPGAEGVAGLGVRIPAQPTGNEVIRWGYFDDSNGFGMQYDSTGLSTFVRSAGIDVLTPHSEWLDPLDGTGVSRYTIDLSNVNIWRFPYRWYGAGPVEFDVSANDPIGGQGRLITFNYSETKSGSPFIETPNLPIRIEVDNQTSATANEVYVQGRHYSVIGNFQPDYRITSEYRINQNIGSASLIPLISYRVKTNSEGIQTRPSGFDIITDSNIRLVLLQGTDLNVNASFGTPTDGDATETSVEFDITADGFDSTGIPIYGTILQGGKSQSGGTTLDLPKFDTPWDGTIVTLAAIAFTQTANISTTLRVQEEW